jgi:hypothetical protein
MGTMDFAPATLTAGPASDRGIARAKCMVRVKFVSLPIREMAPEAARGESRGSGLRPLRAFFTRVIGRLVAARP